VRSCRRDAFASAAGSLAVPGGLCFGRKELPFIKSVPCGARVAYRKHAWAALLGGIYSGAIFPFYLVIARSELKASPLLISCMTAAPFVGNLFALFWANAMEGRPKMPFAAGSWVVARALLILMVVAFTPFRFAIIVCVSQFLATVASPAYAAIMKDIYPDAHRGRIMAYISFVGQFTQITTALVVGVVLSSRQGHHLWFLHTSPQNYRWVFPIGAAVGVVSALIFWLVPTSGPSREERTSKRPTHEFLLSAFSILSEDRNFRWFALSVFTFGFGNLLLLPVVPIFQVDRLHIRPMQVAALSTTTSAVWMVSYLYWGRYVDTRSPLRATAISVFLTLLNPLIYTAAVYVPNVWMLAPAAVIGGVSSAGIDLGYFNSVLRFADERRVSHYQALFSCLLGVRGSVAPFIGGALQQAVQREGWDFTFIFLFAAAIMSAGAMMQVLGVRRQKLSQRA